MRSKSFDYKAPEGRAGSRHRARQINFYDSSVYSYPSPGSHWWGYA